MVRIPGIIILACIVLLTGSLAHARLETEAEIRSKIEKLPEDGREKQKAILYSDLGTRLYKNGKMEAATAAFEKSLEYRSRRSLRKHIYRFLGKSYESSGRLDKSINAYKHAVKLDRRNWRRHRDLAYVYTLSGLHTQAVDSYSQAIRLRDSISQLYFGRAQVFQEMGLFVQAERDLVRSIELGEPTPQIFATLSQVLEGMGRYGEAATALNEALTQTPSINDAARLVYLGAMSQDETLVQKGLDQIYALQVSVDTVQFYESLAHILMKQGHKVLNATVKSGHLQNLLEEYRR